MAGDTCGHFGAAGGALYLGCWWIPSGAQHLPVDIEGAASPTTQTNKKFK